VLALRAAGATGDEIAAKFGVSRRALRTVLTGTKKAKFQQPKRRKFSYQLAWQLRQADLSFQEIADQVGCTAATAAYAVRRYAEGLG
jgi:predicted transcriptional regulator